MIYARLEGTVTLPDRQVPLNFDVTTPTLILGRSDPHDEDPFKPVKRDGVDLGIGVSPKLSRAHAKLALNSASNSFSIHCLGKNGFSIISNSNSPELKITPESPPHPLNQNTLIRFADCQFSFIPVRHSPSNPPPNPSQNHNNSHPSRQRSSSSRSSRRPSSSRRPTSSSVPPPPPPPLPPSAHSNHHHQSSHYPSHQQQQQYHYPEQQPPPPRHQSHHHGHHNSNYHYNHHHRHSSSPPSHPPPPPAPSSTRNAAHSRNYHHSKHSISPPPPPPPPPPPVSHSRTARLSPGSNTNANSGGGRGSSAGAKRHQSPEGAIGEESHSPASNGSGGGVATKRKRRDWIKTEHAALRAQLMRFGYGRWESIIRAATGRLSERHAQELVPVARRFIALCYEHARPGAERKALWDILQRHPRDTLRLDADAVESDVQALVESIKTEVIDAEKRKYVRWARKLRVLSRLNDIIGHRSLRLLRAGELKVFTPPPTLYWTSDDDADLIIGSHKHGYGACETMRNDPELGFLGRYSKAPPSRKPNTPSKPGNDIEKNEDDEDADGDEDPDEDPDADEDEVDEADDESPGEPSSTPNNPRKRFKLGDGSAKKEESKLHAGDYDDDDDDDMMDEPLIDESMKKKLSIKSKAKAEPTEVSAKDEKKKGRIVPRRGPRIGNEDGYNNPEDAKAAHEKMADEKGLVPFPNSEALMRRLKSIINSCAKMYDRDMRDQKKREEAETKAKRRRDDLAERKAIKEAEKTRQRAERRAAKSQPFSKKEAVDFEKALANFGVSYIQDGKTVDWGWFHKKVDGFDAKYDETMWNAYCELLAEAHRIRDLAAAKEDEDFETVETIEERVKPSAVFNTLTFDRAERLIERLTFFRTLRGEVLPHPKLASILKGFKKSKDLPEWWKSCHDRCLLLGIDKYGLNGFDKMGKDPKLSFLASMKQFHKSNDNDGSTAPPPPSSKRASMPKASAGWKRAHALVQYFGSRANDPHFEFYNTQPGGADAQQSAESGVLHQQQQQQQQQQHHGYHPNTDHHRSYPPPPHQQNQPPQHPNDDYHQHDHENLQHHQNQNARAPYHDDEHHRYSQDEHEHDRDDDHGHGGRSHRDVDHPPPASSHHHQYYHKDRDGVDSHHHQPYGQDNDLDHDHEMRDRAPGNTHDFYSNAIGSSGRQGNGNSTGKGIRKPNTRRPPLPSSKKKPSAHTQTNTNTSITNTMSVNHVHTNTSSGRTSEEILEHLNNQHINSMPKVNANGRMTRPKQRRTLLSIPTDEHGALILPVDLGDGLYLLDLGTCRSAAPTLVHNGIVCPVGYRAVRRMGSHALLCEVKQNDDNNIAYFCVSRLENFDYDSVPCASASNTNSNSNNKNTNFSNSNYNSNNNQSMTTTTTTLSPEHPDCLWRHQDVLATGCDLVTTWMAVINQLEDKSHDVLLACGPERFGLYEPTVVYHLQNLPGAKSVTGVSIQDFSNRGGAYTPLGNQENAGAQGEDEDGGGHRLYQCLLSALREHEQLHEQQDGDDEDVSGQAVEEMSIPSEWIRHFESASASSMSLQKRIAARKGSAYWV